MEEEVKKHLDEAERNKVLNAQLYKGSSGGSSGEQQSAFHSELSDKLGQTIDNQEDEAKSKPLSLFINNRARGVHEEEEGAL